MAVMKALLAGRLTSSQRQASLTRRDPAAALETRAPLLGKGGDGIAHLVRANLAALVLSGESTACSDHSVDALAAGAIQDLHLERAGSIAASSTCAWTPR